MTLENDIDALYSGPPEGFVTGRDELAKRLKDGGRPDEAAAVKALRRPTVAAWAVNRVAHEHSRELEPLEDLARDLRKAQRGALSGLRGTALREAVKRRRAVVDTLTDRAVELLEADGRGGASQREAISRTFEAAAADPDALQAVLAGRLDKELQRPTGFGELSGLAAVPRDPGGDSGGSAVGKGRPKRRAAPAEDARLRRLRVQRDEAAEASRSAAQAAVRAGERAVAAGREAEAAAVEIERLERDLRAARRKEREATEAATQAAAAAKKADAEADRTRKKVEDLQARIEKALEG